MIGWIGILVSLGCAPKSEAWLRAKQEDTPEAYRRFLRAEPGSTYAATAKQRMEKLDWREAEVRDNARNWGAYLANHPDSPRAEEARMRLEEARWRDAIAGGKAKLQIFMTNHPDSIYADEAKKRLDDLDWERARGEDTAESYGLYLERHFSGAHAEEARAFYTDRNWQRVIDADTRDAYADFLQRFPDSRYASHAKEELATFQFDTLVVRFVHRSLVRDDSPATIKAAVRKKLEASLKKEDIPFTWAKDLDARDRPDTPVLDGIELEGDAGALVIEIRESRGRAFDPYGYATDIDAVVSLIPKRGTAMEKVEVEASTRKSVLAQTLHGLHLDAHEDLADKLARVPAGWGRYKVAE